MPRRRKHRKHGRNRQKKGQNTKEPPNTSVKTETSVSNAFSENTVSDTLVSSHSAMDYFTPLKAATHKAGINKKDSFEMETPVKTNSLKEKLTTPKDERRSGLFTDCTPLKTPVNKRRSLNRQKEGKLNGTWNVTNLNQLFDSSIAAQSSEISLTIRSGSDRMRSSSSIPKLHSPGKEKPLSFHKSTQTVDVSELEMERENLITETPRVSQKLLSDIDMDKIDALSAKLNNIKNLSTQLTKFSSEEFNINPYLKEKQFVSLELNAQKSRWQKEGSAEELSFFSPQLFEMKTSSTPIDRVEGTKLLNYLKDSVMKESCVGPEGRITNKMDKTPQREAVNRTPRSDQIKDRLINNSFDLTVVDPMNTRRSNVNLNTPPLTEKVLNKDKSNSIKLLGSNKRRNSCASAGKMHNRTSPKFNRLINHSRLLNKNLSYSRLNASRRSLLENSCELASSSITTGVYEKMINKIKRYSKASAKWSVKMMEACAQLGIQIRNGLASLCTVYNENSFLETSQKACKCEEYKAEIGSLTDKINTLNEELVVVKHRQGSTEEELNKLKQELINFTDLRSELMSLKEQFQCFKAAPLHATSAPPAPVKACAPSAPPPPPPPPPPLPPVTVQKVPPRLGLGKKAKSSLGLGSGADNESRPVITLDEILKVKLKKTSERPTTTPLARSRNSTPMISGNLLRQVKLRPQHRPSLLKTPGKDNVSTPAGSSASSEASTSPHSSLCRMLNGDPVWKVKRLRKVGGYSFDSVRRRSPGKLSVLGAGKRDRTGS